MIPKVQRGADMRGLMRYLVGPGTANEHSDPHLVAGSSGLMEWWDDTILDRTAANEIGSLLDKPRLFHGTSVTLPAKEFDPEAGEMIAAGQKAAHVWHCPLSIHAEEGHLGDEKWSAIAHRFVELMAINDGARPAARWAAVHHGDSAKGNDHIHLVVGLVREDGTKVSTHHDYRRAQNACAQIEVEFGLRVTEGRANGRGQRGTSRPEQNRADEGEFERRWLERVVSGAATAARSEDEFVRRVRSSGALIRPRFKSGGQDTVVGYSVAKRTGQGEKPVWFGGGRLSPDLTLPRLRAGWDTSQGEAALAEWRAAWRGTRPVGSGPEFRTPTADTWARAVGELGDLADRLRSVPVEDRATWTRVARQVGGALSAWSTRLEPVPGPLAEAAGKVRDYARTTGREPPADGPPVRLTSQAYLLAAVAVNPDGIGAQLAMLKQLTRTMQALHDVQVAGGELRTARATEVAAKVHLATWRKQLERAALEATPEGRQALAGANLTKMNAPPGQRSAPIPGVLGPKSTTRNRTAEHTSEQGSSRE